MDLTNVSDAVDTQAVTRTEVRCCPQGWKEGSAKEEQVSGWRERNEKELPFGHAKFDVPAERSRG